MLDLPSFPRIDHLRAQTHTWRERVDADAELAPFLGDGTTHLLDGSLTRVVRGARQSLDQEVRHDSKRGERK